MTLSANEIYVACREGKLTLIEVKERLAQLAREAEQPSTSAAWFPLSEAQRGVWFLQQSAPGMSAYNVPVAIGLPAAVDQDAFITACRGLLAQYPILTTTIEDHEGGPRQRQRRDWIPPIHREDVSELGSEELMAHLRRLVRQPFPGTGEALLRIFLLHRSPAQTIVIFNVHHVIFDGGSIVPLVQAFVGSYQDALKGAQRERPAASVSYRSFVEAEQKLISSLDGARRVSFWRERLRDHGDVVQLPADRPRPPQRAFKGETRRRKLSDKLSSSLRKLCRAHLVYPSTLFLGMLQMLLAKYTGTRDVVVGMPVDSRALVTQQAAVGLFATMIPIRSACDDSVALRDFLKTLQFAVIDGIANAYPFGALVRELGAARGGAYTPLFQIAYVYQGSTPGDSRNGSGDGSADLDVQFIEELSQEGNYEIELDIHELQRTFELNLKYDPDVFDTATVGRFLDRYEALLEAISVDPTRSLGDYSLLGEAERRTLLIDWNDTRRERGPDRCLFELFEQQAHQAPHSVAIRSKEGTVSYAELLERSTVLARILNRRGLHDNQIVAVCLERCAQMMFALLAIQKAGGAYLPLDPDYPAERLAYMLQDSRVRIILTQTKLRAVVGTLLERAGFAGDSGIEVIVLDEPWEDPGTTSDLRPVAPTDLVYVLYTSGSTGRPKGVMLEHRSLYNRIVWMQEQYDLEPQDRVLQKTPLSFDVSGWELYWPLIVGAELVLLPSAEHRDSAALIRFIDEYQVSVAHFVPSMLEAFLNTDGVESCQSLRQVFCSGEALTPGQCDQFFERLPASELHNLYGPTEAAIDVTYWECSRNASWVPIGKPIANTRLYVLDERLRPTPIGIAGELHIAGVGLARCYLNNPELTEQRFIPDPFADGEGGRLYRTGDLCRWREDGNIEYLGRLDQQVKLRGFRIELGEVEAHLSAHPQIRTSVAVISERNGHRRLVAWLVAAPGVSRLTDVQLRRYLAAKVPEHMIPAAFAYIETIPLTASGKADRKALSIRDPAQEPPAAQPPAAEVAPEVEHEIEAIWRVLLQRPDLDASRGFFDLGGDSLLAVSAIKRINRKFGTKLTPTALFRYPSVKALAEHVSQALATRARNVAPQAADATLLSNVPRTQEARGVQGKAGYPDYYSESLAIIGISCSVPGATHHFDFWRNLTQGHESIRLLTPAQLREAGVPEELIANPRFVPACSSIEDKELFDSQFFGISPRDAGFMSPQFRLLLQHAWLAIEDSGYRASDIPDTAVFMSESSTPHIRETAEDAGDSMDSDGYVSWILAQGGSTPTMISHKLGLTGPSHAVHSNCSSSLVGLYSAYLNIRAGKCRTALVGASTILGMSAPGYLYHPSMNFSSDGHLKAFDAKADGMVAGEGAVVLLVKNAIDAVEQGDSVYALIRGIEVNNDGHDKAGFYAPSFGGQRKVIQKVLAATGVDPESISYIEAHGTGTKLGDPIELGALTEAYARPDGKRGYCGVGSLKSNIGHLDTAAGLAGCMKVALSLHYGQIPPSINFSEPNPDIDFDRSPFYVVDRLKPWPDAPGPRRAAVSAFGIGGTNAHAILESCAVSRSRVTDRTVVVPISAKTPERLTAYVERIQDFLLADDARGKVGLADLAYTFQVGREPMDCRVAFVAANRGELVSKLSEYLSGDSAIDGVWRAQRHAGGELDKLAQRWVSGVAVDWELLYGAKTSVPRPQRIPAPTYPFAKQRFPLRVAQHAAVLKEVEVGHQPNARGAPSTSWDGNTYLVRWQEEPRSAASRGVAFDPTGAGGILIVCAGESARLEETIRTQLGRERSTRMVTLRLRAAPTQQLSQDEWLCDVRDPFAFAACLEDMPALQGLFFLSDAAGSSPDFSRVQPLQLHNEVQLYRLIKHVRNVGKVDNRLECFFLTFDQYDPEPCPTQYAGAGVTGLAYAVAQREHRFRVRNIDLCAGDLTDDKARRNVVQTILETPASDRGELVKVRPRGRFRQVFVPLSYEPAVKSGIAEHGIYVIAGGSGAVGRIITRGLMRSYHARVIWLGRTPAADRALQEKLSELDRLGTRPTYIEADVTDPQSLRDAVKRIRDTYGRINGTIFMASHIYGRAESLEASEESEFRHSVSVKTDGTAAFYAAFEHEPLDFMCYFSSAQAFSFSGASKLAALATGVTFSDAFVRSLRDGARFPVGTINWGAWRSSVGSALSEHMGALSDEEGFACFERVTGALQQGDLRQFVCLSVSAGVRALMSCRDEEQWVVQAQAPSVMAYVREEVKPARELPEVFRKETQRLPVSFDECLTRILLVRLRDMGVFKRPDVFETPEELRERAGILSKYSRWWTECLRILQSSGYIDTREGKVSPAPATFTDPGDWVWSPWNQVKALYLQDPDLRAYVPIAEASFDRLHEVLTGKTLATEVLFPGGSMKQMEGVYRENAVADYFNNTVAAVVEACVRGMVERDSRAQVRIVEIGAGTGGTTSKVLPKLSSYARHVREYCYTDISKAFLLMAEDQFGPGRPYLTCRLWDIEHPMAEGDPNLGGYDIAIATNVLHATRNVRRALSNAKAALRTGGVLVLNEGTRKNIYGSLIMGLLDGWWLYEDEAYRIPGCPYLDARSWRRVLALEGFRDVYYPVEVAETLGQQIIVADSNGLVKVGRTTRSPQTEPAAARATSRAEIRATRPIRPAASAAGGGRDHVEATIRQCLAEALRTPAGQIAKSVPFSDYGVDSILGVGFTEAVNKRLGLSLNPAVLYDYSSVERLTTYLIENFAAEIQRVPQTVGVTHESSLGPEPGSAEPLQVVATTLEVVSTAAEREKVGTTHRVEIPPSASIAVTSPEIAVIGMSGQFPGASDVESFWENLRSGRHGVSELPASYRNAHEYFGPGHAHNAPECGWGGALAERDCFDPLFFNISPREADSMNPHQRLVLQESWKALEDAGYDPKRLSNAQVGVYIGAEPSGYFHETFTGASEAIIASRLSYFANLSGPALVVNTACSSSAVAIHLACEALRAGQIDMALAGGVNASLSEAALVPLAAVQMLSPTGRCSTFDEAADGTVLSEAVGVVVLKPLERAVRDRDPILGVICGSGINQDGASNGITAPNGLAQERLIKGVYERFNINPADIGYVEAHGTGTKLGDPVEANALVRAFRHFTDRKDYCALGSAKSHIGHTAASAGVAGLIKVLLSLRHGEIPGLQHFTTLNRLIDLEGSAFYINPERRQWPSVAGRPRMAALNAFGHSGTNAHLVIREHLGKPQPTVTRARPLIVPLSARREDVLKSYAGKLLDYLNILESSGREPGAADQPTFSDIAYTLQVGREPMSHRVAFLASTSAQLRCRLEEFLGHGADGVTCWYGQVAATPDDRGVLLQDEDLGQLMVTWLAGSKSEKVARLWAQGTDVDWTALWEGQTPRRVRLPTYPFLKNRHGKDTAFIKRGARPAAAPEDERVAPDPKPIQGLGDEARGGQSFTTRVIQELIQAAGTLLTLDAQLIDPHADLSRYGFDSISLTEFTHHLNRHYGLTLMPTVFFECPTLELLGKHLVESHEALLRSRLDGERHGSAVQGAPAATELNRRPSGLRPMWVSTSEQLIEPANRPPAGQRRPENAHLVPEPIAIVGMSGCFPQSPDIESFGRALDEGRDCITEIPPDRWDWRALYGDPQPGEFKTLVKWGGFIDSTLSFDPLFFGISPREAELMDPQQRLLLTHAWKVIEDAGYAPSSLAGSRTGVYVGTADTGYGLLVAQASRSIEGFSGTSVAQSVGPNRVSFLLDLHGPSEPIDTACSSSMVAIHHAVNALRAGQCDLAIAGGVNTIVTPTIHVAYAKTGMLSPEGRCKPFSDEANGFVRGEGVGMVLLKRLVEAERDGDHIEGVIVHIGENHGGRATSLTAPNTKAQADLIRAVYEEARIDPRTVTYVEAHGTGTQLGDPVEFNALKSAFGALYEKTADSGMPAGRCGLGSVKSNIGHLELAAGVAGVIKVLLQMRHQRLARSLHCRKINPYIDLHEGPFYIVDEPQKWVALQDQQGRTLPRRAGVSSFGFAGVNTHVLLEEYRSSGAAQEPHAGPHILVLSARTPEQLQHQAKNLLEALRTDRYAESDLGRIAYTLQLGRDAFAERLGFVATSLSEAREKLESYLQGPPAQGAVHCGQAKSGKAALSIFRNNDELQEAIGKWLERGRFDALLELWVQGLEMDWGRLYTQRQPVRISLPTYPFSQQTYSVVEAPAGGGEQAEQQQADVETTLTLTPVWDPVALATDTGVDVAGQRFICIGIEPAGVRDLAARATHVEALELSPDDSIEQIARRLELAGPLDHIVWAFRNPPDTAALGDAVIQAQGEGVMLCFKVIKALNTLGYQSRKLTWTALTERAIAVSDSDTVVAVHAGVHGLMGSLSKENLNWAVHVIDLSTSSQQAAVLADGLRLPAPQPWEDPTWAHRNGSWYRPRLLDFAMAASATPDICA